MTAQLLIGIFIPSESLAETLREPLSHSRFVVSWSENSADFLDWAIDNRHQIDCLILQQHSVVYESLIELQQRDILLPTLIVESERRAAELDQAYHEAVIKLAADELADLEKSIHKAVDRFLKLPAVPGSSQAELSAPDHRLFLLSLQQQRLSEKLKERLGYLGVYYKRNPRNFLRSVSVLERDEFLNKLRQDYRHIILIYFSQDDTLNQKIDDFVNVAFFADISISQIVEIHMELIDEFSKQLQLEGRNEEILLDYRLTLIDLIAHLCEMYRRSIPRE
ncbi:circadian clock protein KaiA [Romeria aff. gracilis LEGE 07310]|uniref:Circadian clock oscillator protein KaiA n=1 Tax=Vasconcelosia minhoensis LEGE 07310 TaxID=915328 RepID=A0A8J7AMG0_9CYAN|nr:circadian clock protein KaiA [Romeria gracilis]MBE9076981.1 circadian clock protein KaiA [Romeria aff. gracilis LEGE 07310]